MIDTHSHIDFKEFDDDREDVIARFFDGGGKKLINAGCDMNSCARSLDLASKYENIFSSIGVHPHGADTVNEHGLRRLEEMVEHYKVVAVGEIGLDFYRNISSREKQIEALGLQLELAENHGKPVILHCRDAYNELLDILRSYKTSNWKGVVHCFTASREIAEQFLSLGFHIGFTGIATYYKDIIDLDGEPEIYKVIKNVPSDRMLVETDCPYLAPVPMRGSRNEPVYLKHIIEKISKIKNIDYAQIEKNTSSNACELFNIQ